MTKVRIKATKKDVEQSESSGDFVLPPQGYYAAAVDQCNFGYSKTDGEEDKEKPRLEVIYKIVGEGPDGGVKPKANYGNIWDYVSFSEAAGWKRAEFGKAFGLPFTPDGELDAEFDTDDVVGRKVTLRLRHEKGNTKDDPSRAKVARTVKFGNETGVDVAGSAPDYGTDSATGMADPFGSTESTESTESTDPYTVDELEALDLKELGKIAKEEFELDTAPFIVRNGKKIDNDKTKDNVLKAILKAQSDEDSDADEDDPF